MHISRLLVGAVIAVLLRGNAIAGPLEDCAAAFDRQDYAAAHQLCRPLAEQGDARAQTSLAGMYYNGQGVQRDYAEAAKWVRRAAEQGYAPAQADLGVLYWNGQGLPQDAFGIIRALRGRRAACHPGDIGPVTVTLRSVTSPLDSE